MTADALHAARADEEFTPQSPWLDLVNSEQWDGFGVLTDHLDDPAWMRRFLGYWGVRPGDLGRSAPRAELVRLRALLRRLTERIASGVTLSPDEIRAVNGFLEAPGRLHLVAEDDRFRTELRPVRRNWRWIRARITASFVDALQAEPGRIKRCDNPQCRWAFVDGTKGNVRRWCKDRRCGNRARVRRARAQGRGR